MSKAHKNHNFFKKVYDNKDSFIASFFGEGMLEDKILETEENLSHYLDMGDANRIDSTLIVLDQLYRCKILDQNNNKEEQEFNPEHLFDDINYFRI